ncbi:MAG: DNA repair protein RecO [Fimbriimonadales bacterium]|nr:DNA repair protein RecO [Fimbriimonadales bacterium]
MAREFQTEGIVLRRWYAGEYDKWVSFLTPAHGKLRLRVRGARKPQSKMGMLTEPLNWLKARVIEGKAQRLIAQPQLVRSAVQARGDLERLSAALALCETLDRWLPEEHPEPEAYATLQAALEALESGAPVEPVAAWALWRWLASLGYCLEIGQCSGCGAAFVPVRRDANATCGGSVASATSPTIATLVPAEGVLLCARCAPPRQGIALAADALELLQGWVQGEPLHLDARPEAYRSLMRAAVRYAECVLESPVRWLEFWERLNALRDSG